jgi:hypothetical protein
MSSYFDKFLNNFFCRNIKVIKNSWAKTVPKGKEADAKG